MAENKAKPSSTNPEKFIAAVGHETRRSDAETLLEIMGRATGYEPKMWGPTIVGFGRYHYVYESGREGAFLALPCSQSAHGIPPKISRASCPREFAPVLANSHSSAADSLGFGSVVPPTASSRRMTRASCPRKLSPSDHRLVQYSWWSLVVGPSFFRQCKADQS